MKLFRLIISLFKRKPKSAIKESPVYFMKVVAINKFGEKTESVETEWPVHPAFAKGNEKIKVNFKPVDGAIGYRIYH